MRKSNLLFYFSLFLLVGVFGCNKDKQSLTTNDSELGQNVDKIDKDADVTQKKSDKIIALHSDFTPSSTTGMVVKRNSYVFSYNEDHEQSEWVAYYLTKADIPSKKYKRPYFNQDPKVKTGSADWKNYSRTNYNKGHLLPAADRRKNYADYKETFFTSNIAPQLPEFNAGIWNDLEMQVRKWVKQNDSLYVITGGILEQNLPTIGYEKVSVPNYFYKIVATPDFSNVIAFLVPHQNSNLPLFEFVTSVDSIEKLTGIDFFEQLPLPVQENLESKKSYNEWRF